MVKSLCIGILFTEKDGTVIRVNYIVNHARKEPSLNILRVSIWVLRETSILPSHDVYQLLIQPVNGEEWKKVLFSIGFSINSTVHF